MKRIVKPPMPPCSTYKEFFGVLIENNESRSLRKRFEIKSKVWRLINEDNSRV